MRWSDPENENNHQTGWIGLYWSSPGIIDDEAVLDIWITDLGLLCLIILNRTEGGHETRVTYLCSLRTKDCCDMCVDIEDDIDTDWWLINIFSACRAVELYSEQCSATGCLFYPELDHHYEMSSQAHRDASPLSCNLLLQQRPSWPNITTLDSSLVINITHHTTHSITASDTQTLSLLGFT